MLSQAGSYDFGGLAAVRQITEPKLTGRSGYLFVFIIRQRVSREDGDECLFKFSPVFASAGGEIDESALEAAVAGTSADPSGPAKSPPDPAIAYGAAKQHLEKKESIWDWNDDIEFLGLSWVEFK